MALFLVIRGVFHCVCYYVKLCIFFLAISSFRLPTDWFSPGASREAIKNEGAIPIGLWTMAN